MRSELEESCELLNAVKAGDPTALGPLLSRYGDRLRRMIRLRVHPMIRPRIDEDDVIQEVLLEGSQRLSAYLKDPPMPFFLWLRFLTAQRLVALMRHHLGVRARDANREVRLDRGQYPGATSVGLAEGLAAHWTTPTQAAVRAEVRDHIALALDEMEPIDREIIALRHFEHLTNGEAARELSIDVSAASKRYVRALTRLRRVLDAVPGLRDT